MAASASASADPRPPTHSDAHSWHDLLHAAENDRRACQEAYLTALRDGRQEEAIDRARARLSHALQIAYVARGEAHGVALAEGLGARVSL